MCSAKYAGFDKFRTSFQFHSQMAGLSKLSRKTFLIQLDLTVLLVYISSWQPSRFGFHGGLNGSFEFLIIQETSLSIPVPKSFHIFDLPSSKISHIQTYFLYLIFAHLSLIFLLLILVLGQCLTLKFSRNVTSVLKELH